MWKGIIIGTLITYSILNPTNVYNLLNGIRLLITNDDIQKYYDEGYNHIELDNK